MAFYTKELFTLSQEISNLSPRVFGFRFHLIMASNSKALASSSKEKQPSYCAINFSNFLKGVPPQRLMFYLHGDWKDFPKFVTPCLIQAFKERKVLIDFKVDGSNFIVDFAHMVVIEVKTQAMQSIAWIDESNKCCFPKILYDGEKFLSNYNKEISEAGCLDYGCQNIVNLTLKLKEIEENKSGIIPSHGSVRFDSFHDSLVKLEGRSTSYLVVQNSFLNSMASFVTPSSIIAIYQYIPNHCLGETFRSIFRKEAEITRLRRGNPNIRAAWLGMSREGIMEIVHRRFHTRPNLSREVTYGIGVHCSPASYSYMSVSDCDVDEQGVQHMLLCRAIVGNMEKVQPGTDQFCPSSDHFDTGVDDLRNPRVHVIWSSRVICNLHPEYIVSFKLSSMVRDYYAMIKRRQACSSILPVKP